MLVCSQPLSQCPLLMPPPLPLPLWLMAWALCLCHPLKPQLSPQPWMHPLTVPLPVTWQGWELLLQLGPQHSLEAIPQPSHSSPSPAAPLPSPLAPQAYPAGVLAPSAPAKMTCMPSRASLRLSKALLLLIMPLSSQAVLPQTCQVGQQGARLCTWWVPLQVLTQHRLGQGGGYSLTPLTCSIASPAQLSQK
ncbi:hypothetical protein V8C86DRAFT_2621989 [Haematococcus lacustris]